VIPFDRLAIDALAMRAKIVAIAGQFLESLARREPKHYERELAAELERSDELQPLTQEELDRWST
jgi:hypothetical protein